MRLQTPRAMMEMCASGTWMGFGDLVEEKAVPGHGEIDARRAEDGLVGGAHDGKEDDEGNNRSAQRADDDVHDVAGDPRRFGDLARGEDIEVGHVGDDVDDDAGHGADEKAHRQVALRALDLAGAVGRSLPSFIGQREATRATPNAPNMLPERPVGNGRIQLDALASLAKIKTMMQTAARATNLMIVRKFWRLAPSGRRHS